MPPETAPLKQGHWPALPSHGRDAGRAAPPFAPPAAAFRQAWESGSVRRQIRRRSGRPREPVPMPGFLSGRPGLSVLADVLLVLRGRRQETSLSSFLAVSLPWACFPACKRISGIHLSAGCLRLGNGADFFVQHGGFSRKIKRIRKMDPRIEKTAVRFTHRGFWCLRPESNQ